MKQLKESLRVGVLALQGGFAAHSEVLRSLGCCTMEVRSSQELEHCDALIIPGGESTTMTHLIKAVGNGFYEQLSRFCASHPVMGTCAGLIMLSESADDQRVRPFGLLPVTVQRNAYGRQNESSVQDIQLDPSVAKNNVVHYKAVFIRAPRIQEYSSAVQVLAVEASSGSDSVRAPILVRYQHILGLSFHPELTPKDTRIHEYFLAMCLGR